jgi:hypothetical protein
VDNNMPLLFSTSRYLRVSGFSKLMNIVGMVEVMVVV